MRYSAGKRGGSGAACLGQNPRRQTCFPRQADLHANSFVVVERTLYGGWVSSVGSISGGEGDPGSGKGFYLLMAGFFPPVLISDPLIGTSLPQANTFQSNITLHPD